MWSGIPISLRIFQFLVIHTVKGFGTFNKAEVDILLQLSCFFDDATDVGNLISGSSTFSKSSLNIWKFMVQVLLKPDLENFEHYLLAHEMSAIVWCFEHFWHCFSLGLEWKLTFSSPVAAAEFSNFAGTLSTVFSKFSVIFSASLIIR